MGAVRLVFAVSRGQTTLDIGVDGGRTVSLLARLGDPLPGDRDAAVDYDGLPGDEVAGFRRQ